MFRFGSIDFLFAYLLIPLLGILFWYAARRRRQAMELFADRKLLPKLSESVSPGARLTKTVLVLAASFLLITALARPQFGSRIETVKREGQDIVIAIDVSSSMLAEDISPNRLERARHAISSLIDRLQGDRIALVAFAGRAFVQCPLTLDYGAAKLFLNAIQPDLIPVPGTALGEALDVSLGAFKSTGSSHKVVVLITDGEDHSGKLEEVLETARESGVVIHSVGIGSPKGVPIPEFDSSGRRSGFKKSGAGEVVLTRLDESILQEVARRSGGRYFRAAADRDELGLLAEEISGMEKKELDALQVTNYQEQYQLFLALALLLFTVEVLVPERRRFQTQWRGRFQ